MDTGVGHQQTVATPKPSKFSVYQNVAFSAALTSSSVGPSASTWFFLLSLSSVSVLALILSLMWEKAAKRNYGLGILPRDAFVSDALVFFLVVAVFVIMTQMIFGVDTAVIWPQIIATIAIFVLVGSLLAFSKAVLLWRKRNSFDVVVQSPSEEKKELKHLTKRQLSLMGLGPKLAVGSEDSSKDTRKSKTGSPSLSIPIIPSHQSIASSGLLSRLNGDRSSVSGDGKQYTFASPSKSPSSPSMYLVPAAFVPSSMGGNQLVSTPWSSSRRRTHKDIASEEDLERFLADEDEKVFDAVSKMTTPPPTVNVLSVASPGSVSTSGTTRSAPLRAVRMSPSSQKFKTPPKKGEGELPSPMSMEESVEAFKRLGIYLYIEQWRDRLRQWFSAVVLNPLLVKIESSHLKVIEAAAKLNIQITVSQLGSDTPTTPAKSPTETTTEWKPSFAADEDVLHQIRATLSQVLDSWKQPASSLQQSSQLATSIPLIQECVDAITEHQRLRSLLKGEWGKGLLPCSIQEDYTVKRIRNLAEGTCLKNYKYLGKDDAHDTANKTWSPEFPSDSHLLLYLFTAFLENPKWMLHVDPTNFAGGQSSKNPLFLGCLPPKERFPEKYIAILSGVPSLLHPGATILAIGKQNPPVFALYWDKKPHFSFQGRTALWDSILLLCYKVKTSYDGIIRGVHLGSSALKILPILEQVEE